MEIWRRWYNKEFSWQEAAAIQTFPRGMEFCGDLTSKYKQIGNAVPVRLAEAVAEKVYEKLCECLEVSKNELEVGVI